MRSGTPRDRVEYRLQVQCAITAPAAPLPTFDPSSCLRLQGSTGRRSNGRASIKSQPRLQLSGRVGQRSEKISCAHRGREPSAPAIGGCSRQRRRSPPQRGGGVESILSLARSPLLHSACKCVALLKGVGCGARQAEMHGSRVSSVVPTFFRGVLISLCIPINQGPGSHAIVWTCENMCQDIF